MPENNKQYSWQYKAAKTKLPNLAERIYISWATAVKTIYIKTYLCNMVWLYVTIYDDIPIGRYGIENLGRYGMEWLDVIEFDGMGLSTV